MDSCHQPFDGDIAGLGVRLSFYLQNSLLVLLVDRSYADAESALWTFIATSFGLTIAAIVQVSPDGLSLLEGILVSQLAWFANIGTFLALASYSRSKGKDNLVKVAAVLQGYFSMILTIVMWTFADRLPLDPQCDVKFVVFFGVELAALRSGRTVALVFASLTIIVYTGVTFIECRAWWKYGKFRIRPEEHDLEIGPKSADRDRRGSSGSANTSRHVHNKSSISSKKGRRPRKHAEWLGTEVDPIFFGIILSQVIILTYFISTTEKIIQGNNASPRDSFGFGQVLALTVLLPSVIALYRALQSNRIAKLRDLQKREYEKTRANDTHSVYHSPKLDTSISLPPIPPHHQLTVPGEDPPSRASSSGLAPATMEGGSSIHSYSTSVL